MLKPSALGLADPVLDDLDVAGLRLARGYVGLVGPSFGPFDEFHGEDEGHGECDLSESLPAEPVGVAAQLTKVG